MSGKAIQCIELILAQYSQNKGGVLMLNKRLACLAAAVLLCFFNDITVAKAFGQTKPKAAPEVQKFKVRTDLVEVHAVVTDRKSNIIENLKKEDFELLENNRPQEISFFSVSGVKDESIHSNGAVGLQSVREQLNKAPARSILLFVDNLHLSFFSLDRVKQALIHFIDERMTEQDMVAIVTSRGTLGVAQQFTRDRQLLRYGIERISLGSVKPESAFTPKLAVAVLENKTGAMEAAIDILKMEDFIVGDYRTMCELTRGRATKIVSEAAFYRRATLSIIGDLSKQMTDLPGQRMIIVFSDGFTMLDTDNIARFHELDLAINSANRAGVMIYSIDTLGLLSLPPAIPGSVLIRYQGHEEEIRGLHAMAVDTGGQMYQNTGDLSYNLSQIYNANRYSYVLGYYLRSDSDVSKFRNIKVRVRNHPEYSVRTPRGFASSDTMTNEDEAEKTPQQRLLQAVNSPLALANLGVSVLADFMETERDDKQVSLKVYLEGNKLQYREQNQHRLCGLEILYVIYDSEGNRVDACSANVEANLTSEGLTQAQTNGYLFLKRLALKPGVYQARIGVREVSTDRIGTATAWIEVPKLASKSTAMSSLTLQDLSSASPAISEGFSVNEMKQGQMAQGIRLYARGNACNYFFRVYRGMQPPSSGLMLRKEFLQSGVPVKQEPWQLMSEEEAKPDSKGWFDITGKVDLAEFKPGIYEMRISVKDNKSDVSAQRSAIFGVE
jgi:VWFA-related protein